MKLDATLASHLISVKETPQGDYFVKELIKERDLLRAGLETVDESGFKFNQGKARQLTLIIEAFQKSGDFFSRKGRE